MRVALESIRIYRWGVSAIRHQDAICLAPKQVAGLLRVTEETLMHWRKQKKGPPYYRRVTKIVYYQHEVDEWMDQTRWG
jgi:hypothetical protein